MVAISYPANTHTPSNTGVVAPLVLGAVALLALVVGIRAVQGTPPATGLHGAPVAEITPFDAAGGEAIITVGAGDTLWDLAGALAPHLDRREAVSLLAERNGTSSLQAGQELIVPAAIVDAGLAPSSQLAAGSDLAGASSGDEG